MSHSTDLSGLRVLVVEDNFLFAEALCDELAQRECVVVGPASSLDDGLALARESSLDGAFLDINLSGEFCFPIANMLAKRGVPFVFLTGYDDPGIVPSGLQSARRLSKLVAFDEIAAVAADFRGRH